MDDDIEQMVTDLENRESKLSDWERGFVDSVSRAIGRGQALTDGQKAKLEEVWERVTA